MEWDNSGRKGRDGQKKKVGKANEKRKKVKKSKKTVKWMDKEGKRRFTGPTRGFFLTSNCNWPKSNMKESASTKLPLYPPWMNRRLPASAHDACQLHTHSHAHTQYGLHLASLLCLGGFKQLDSLEGHCSKVSTSINVLLSPNKLLKAQKKRYWRVRKKERVINYNDNANNSITEM